MARVVGTAGDDNLVGTDDADVLIGGRGDDDIFAGDGNDVIRSGSGNDLIDVGGGFDQIIVRGAGDKIITGETGVGSEDLIDVRGFGTRQNNDVAVEEIAGSTVVTITNEQNPNLEVTLQFEDLALEDFDADNIFFEGDAEGVG